MENKPAQNIQDTFLNTVRKDKTPITIYLVSGVKLTGKIRSFDKYSVLLENNSQEQLIFKHAISTVVSNRSVMHTEHRPALTGMGPSAVPAPAGCSERRAAIAREGAPQLAFGDGGAGARPGSPSANADDRAGKPERAVLVGVELTVRSRATRPGLAGARLAAAAPNRTQPVRMRAKPLPSPAFPRGQHAIRQLWMRTSRSRNFASWYRARAA